MKKARTVDIPVDRPLTFDEYTDLCKHAINSGIWNATKYNKNSWQIREKLLMKGYLDGSVYYIDTDGTEKQADIISDTLKHLIERDFLNDKDLAENFVYNSAMSGVSLLIIRQKMSMKLFPSYMIDEVVNNFTEKYGDTDSDGLAKAAEKLSRSSSFRKLDEIKKKQKFMRVLVSKGFSYSDIQCWMEDNLEELS